MGQAFLQPSGDRRDLTIRQRLGLLLVVFLLGVAGATTVAHTTVSERNAAVSGIEERVEPARRHLDVLTMRVAVADSAESGDPGSEEAVTALERVGALLAPYESMEDEVAALERAVVEWLAGGVTQEALLRDVHALRRVLWAEQAGASGALAEANSRLSSLLWAVLVLSVVIGVATWVCLQRWINTPLSRVATAADRVREGDLHHRIPVLGAPELRALAGNVDRMRSRIVGLYETCSRATEALDQQGVAVVSLRAELEPTAVDLPEGVRFAAALEPAEGVLAGDWYECMDLGDGKVALAVADVSGHGPEAGIFALRAKHLLQAALEDDRSPGDALGWLADHIGDTGERFLTVLLAEIDTRTGACRWASAGHPPGAIVRGGGTTLLGATGPILGPLPGRWRTEETEMGEGAVLVGYTDGLVEIRRGDEQFGYDRLCALARESAGLAPAEVVDHCVGRVREFASGRAADDLTFVALSLARVSSPSLVNGAT